MRKIQILVFAIGALLLAGGAAAFAGPKPDLQNADVIRFHVIANSDSSEDQALKRRIRDRILEQFSKTFSNVHTVDESKLKINENLRNIEKVASMEILRSHKNYSVKATLGPYDFPTKMYGNKVYPAGRYEALRVVIGEGKGQNWWCVMFPPLCFVDASHGTALASGSDKDDKEKEGIQEAALKQDEIKMQEMEDGLPLENDKNQIQLKFKIAEWWKESEPQLAKVFSFLTDWK